MEMESVSPTHDRSHSGHPKGLRLQQSVVMNIGLKVLWMKARIAGCLSPNRPSGRLQREGKGQHERG